MSMHAADWQALGEKVKAHLAENWKWYGIIAAILAVFLLGRCSA